MGLDWNPMVRPKAGHEEEFERLFSELDRVAESEGEAAVSRLRELSEHPSKTLGAPQVGLDAAADAWLKEKLDKAGQADELERTREALRGYFVLELLPACDGFPVYTNYGLSERVERYSFRANILADVEDLLGPDLMKQAHSSMFSKQLEQFGRALQKKAQEFARAHGAEEVEKVRAPKFDRGTDAGRAHLLFAAAKWCLFWAERGHGMDPSF